ncbi:hypothetical protein BGZ65_003887 [Modicella reniformis]|uniref:Uncharacterized protein n=1 Tax=Modicella reniformis TaxID=1440133 RepID=A0A9P6M941_9FUNG|nr:hypothetical protein BGZ65_003887 [Modicella reniformis]
MKYIPALLALGLLSCFQPLVLAQTTPTFENTAGLVVTTPFNGMTAYQNSFVSIGASLAQLQPMSNIVITVAKSDGSSNSTIFDLKGGAPMLRLIQSWNVSATLFPVGEYHLQLVVVPGANAPATSSNPATATAPTTTTTTTSPTVSTPASVYYWRGLIRVVEPRSKGGSTKSAALAYGAGSAHTGAVAIVYKMSIALGALALGYVIVL